MPTPAALRSARGGPSLTSNSPTGLAEMLQVDSTMVSKHPFTDNVKKAVRHQIYGAIEIP